MFLCGEPDIAAGTASAGLRSLWTLAGQSSSKGESGQEFRAGTWRQEPLKNAACLLACSLSSRLTGLRSAGSSFCTAQAYLPGDGAAHSGLGPPTLITNQDYLHRRSYSLT